GSDNIARNTLCYLDGPQSIGLSRPLPSMTHVPASHHGLVEGRGLAWARSAFFVVVVLVLIALGIANIELGARWHDVGGGVLAAVGLFTLFVGASVRLRRPHDQATLHFFWLCVAFFGTFTFSFNGPFDRLDWIFYWGDVAAMALLPPLLLHFTLVFPERPAE